MSTLNGYHRERISLENSLDEYRIQGEILRGRVASEGYGEIARHLSQFYILVRDAVGIRLKLPLVIFRELIMENLSQRIETNLQRDAIGDESFSLIHRVQARETSLRCFQSIYTYLSSTLSTDELHSLLIIWIFLEDESIDDLCLFEFVLQQLHPLEREMNSVCDESVGRPSFVSCHSWLMCHSDQLKDKYPHLTDDLIAHREQWQEYLSSTNQLDLINNCPYEKTKSMSLIDRFLLGLILKPDQVR